MSFPVWFYTRGAFGSKRHLDLDFDSKCSICRPVGRRDLDFAELDIARAPIDARGLKTTELPPFLFPFRSIRN